MGAKRAWILVRGDACIQKIRARIAPNRGPARILVDLITQRIATTTMDHRTGRARTRSVGTGVETNRRRSALGANDGHSGGRIKIAGGIGDNWIISPKGQGGRADGTVVSNVDSDC